MRLRLAFVLMAALYAGCEARTPSSKDAVGTYRSASGSRETLILRGDGTFMESIGPEFIEKGRWSIIQNDGPMLELDYLDDRGGFRTEVRPIRRSIWGELVVVVNDDVAHELRRQP